MKKIFLIISAILMMALVSGCSTDEDAQVLPSSTSTGVTVDDAESLFAAVSFEGGDSYDREFTAASAPAGGSLAVTQEMAITSDGSSSFAIVPDIEAGYYIHAYMYSIPGSGKSVIVPVDANGDTYSTAPKRILALSDNAPSLATTTRSRYTQNCSGQEMIVLSPTGTTGGQSAQVQVQAYVHTDTPQATPFNPDDFTALSQNWTTPATLNISAISVGSGDFQVTLTWDTTADVDLHLVEPDNNEIYYGNKQSDASTGYLDVDDTNGFGPENIFYNDSVPSGQYTVKVKHYSGAAPTNYTVTIKDGSSINSYTGTLSNAYEEDVITTVNR